MQQTSRTILSVFGGDEMLVGFHAIYLISYTKVCFPACGYNDEFFNFHRGTYHKIYNIYKHTSLARLCVPAAL